MMTGLSFLYYLISMVLFYRCFLYLLELISVKGSLPDSVADIYDSDTLYNQGIYRIRCGRARLLYHFLLLFLLYQFVSCDVPGLLACHASRPDLVVVLLPVTVVAAWCGLGIPFRYAEQVVFREKYGLGAPKHKAFWKKEILSLLWIILLFSAASLLGKYTSELPAAASSDLSGADVPLLPFVLFAVLIPAAFHLLVPWFRVCGLQSVIPDEALKKRFGTLAASAGFRGRVLLRRSNAFRTVRGCYSPIGKAVVLCLPAAVSLDSDPAESNDSVPVLEDELCAVALHSMARAVSLDVWKEMLLTFMMSSVFSFGAFAAFRFVFDHPDLTMSDLLPSGTVLAAFVWIMLVFPVYLTLDFWILRRQATQADRTTAKKGFGESLISVLKLNASLDYEDLNPLPLKTFFCEARPPLPDRVAVIRECGRANAERIVIRLQRPDLR